MQHDLATKLGCSNIYLKIQILLIQNSCPSDWGGVWRSQHKFSTSQVRVTAVVGLRAV